MISKSSFINFSQSTQDPQQKRDSNKNILINLGVLTGTTALGTTTGYYLYHKDKLDINEKTKKAIDEAEKLRPEGLKKAAEQLDINFYNLTAEKHKSNVFPSSIMLIGESQVIGNHMIEDLGIKSNCNFVQIKNTENILEHLEKAKKIHKTTSKKTLLNILGFEDFIKSNNNSNEKIEKLNNYLSNCAKDYHTTIIFSTKNPSKLDKITAQVKINIDVKSEDYIKYLEASIKEGKISDKYWRKPTKTKIFIGTVIGAVIGILGILIKNSNFKNKN